MMITALLLQIFLWWLFAVEFFTLNGGIAGNFGRNNALLAES